MQLEITETIVAFFAGHLSRKPTQEELQKLHDEFTVDFEGMYEHANKIGTTYSALLTCALVDKYQQEILDENEAYRLCLSFRNASEMALTALVNLKQAAHEILKSNQTGTVMDMVSSDLDAKVTVLEPLMLKVFLDDVLKSCNDASLKEMVLRKDPGLSKQDDKNINWFDCIIQENRLTVESVKRVRTIFNPSLVDIKDAKRIVELVLKGYIAR